MELELKQKDELLEGFAEASNSILTTTDYDKGIQQALEHLGKALDVDRVYIFKNHPHNPMGIPACTQLVEWCSDNVDSQMGNPILQNLPYNEVGLEEWYNKFTAGEIINGLVKDLSDIEKEILEPQDILSLLVVPIYVGEKLENFWGFIGFDDCHKERTWSVEEKSIIQVAAASIGGAMIRSKMEEDLEKMVGDRTRDLIFALEKINQTQQQLVEQEKMASLGNLVAGIAHEINTPIGIGVTAISHLLNSSNDLDRLLQEGKMKKSDLVKYISTVKESSNMVYSNLNRASELIKGFKQIAVDRSSEILRKFNMKDYLDELITSLRPQLKNRKQKVIVNCPESYEVYSNPGAYSQIITNLILNSLLHGYDSHEDVGKIEITIKEKEGKLSIHYIDDGKGMPLEVKEKIFEPFYTTNRGNGGTGLGMHIVYNLVTQSLGGTIHCESEEGIGTKFDIIIPIENTE